MRKITVDIFFCNRRGVKAAIREYLADIKRFKGITCPSVILLGDKLLNPSFDADVPIYRLFSVQRRPGSEVKIVVNLSVRAAR